MWEKAPSEVTELVEETIRKHHTRLLDARIGVLMREEATKSNGRVVLGKASLVNAQWLPLLKQELDFVIWFAADYWYGVLDERQKVALVDHELCHCVFDEETHKAKMRGHDVEEFVEIVQRHGSWDAGLQAMSAAIMNQAKFSFGEGHRAGRVVAVEIGKE